VRDRSRPRRRSTDLGVWTGILAIALLGASPAALAHPAKPLTGKEIPCAKLKRVGGRVEILDATRTHVLVTRESAPIGCGSWISVREGWAVIQHRDGQTIHAGPNTFFQIPDNNPDGYFSGDHVVLYQGEIAASSGGGAGEFRVVTANARARVVRGDALVVFSPQDESTQLIALEQSAMLENRFRGDVRITVHQGEATVLDFSRKRVVPSTPAAVALSSLRDKVLELGLSDEEKHHYMELAKARGDRAFPKLLVTSPEELRAAARKPASTRSRSHETYPATEKTSWRQPASQYLRHDISAEEQELLREKQVSHLVGGNVGGEKALFPNQFYGKPQKAAVHVVDADARRGRAAARGKVDPEKAKLIEELSRLGPDE
jgi:hypothetical protein